MDLKQAIKSKGKTLSMVAKEAELGTSTVSEICSGKRKKIEAETVKKIADSLGEDMETVLGYIKQCSVEEVQSQGGV